MRPIWKGHITFGLVNVPVTLYPAEQRSDLHLHMLDSRNRSRVRYQRVNAETGEEVPWDQIVKGFEYDSGSYVVIEEEELKEASPEATRSVEIEGFVDLAEIDPIYFDRPYYLEPGAKGEKGYALLRDTLAESGKAGIASVVIRTRQYVAAMAVRERALVLYLLRYAQEVRPMDDLTLPGPAKESGVTAAEMKMARTLVDSMEMEWDASAYHDEYRAALMEWIERKIESGDIARAPEAGEPGEAAAPPKDMMEALRESVSHAAGRGRADAKKKTTKKRGGTRTTRKTKG